MSPSSSTPSPLSGRRVRAGLLAALTCTLLGWALGAPARGQETTPTTTETTPTQAAPTETAPTETTPTQTVPQEPTTPAPNEYVESLPSGSGQAPAAPPAKKAETPRPAPIERAARRRESKPAASAPVRKQHRRHRKRREQARERPLVDVPAPAAPSVPVAPAGADVGDGPGLVWLGLALVMITGAVFSTAVARRRRAGL